VSAWQVRASLFAWLLCVALFELWPLQGPHWQVREGSEGGQGALPCPLRAAGRPGCSARMRPPGARGPGRARACPAPDARRRLFLQEFPCGSKSAVVSLHSRTCMRTLRERKHRLSLARRVAVLHVCMCSPCNFICEAAHMPRSEQCASHCCSNVTAKACPTCYGLFAQKRVCVHCLAPGGKQSRRQRCAPWPSAAQPWLPESRPHPGAAAPGGPPAACTEKLSVRALNRLPVIVTCLAQ